jgi:hypothetical protein
VGSDLLWAGALNRGIEETTNLCCNLDWSLKRQQMPNVRQDDHSSLRKGRQHQLLLDSLWLHLVVLAGDYQCGYGDAPRELGWLEIDPNNLDLRQCAFGRTWLAGAGSAV